MLLGKWASAGERGPHELVRVVRMLGWVLMK